VGVEEIVVYGHENITGRHKTTFEFTKDSELGLKGDCIIGIKANKACKDLSKELKKAIWEGKKIKMEIIVNHLRDEIIFYGHKDLELNHEKDIVIRKSNWMDGRTLGIKANKSAHEIKEEIIKKMKNPNQKMIVRIYF